MSDSESSYDEDSSSSLRSDVDSEPSRSDDDSQTTLPVLAGPSTSSSIAPSTSSAKQAVTTGLLQRHASQGEEDLELLDDILTATGPTPTPVPQSAAAKGKGKAKVKPEVYPTTIVEAAAEESAGELDDEALIPTTVDTNDETNSLSYTETSAAAYNSFWKYKKLPKGPKVKQKFALDVAPPKDLHKPLVFSDPVFDTAQKNTVGHYGKARIGDGNDISPNPRKLSRLGQDIQFINTRMGSLGDSSQEKKEKMRLSSRICRMKRSANHEANKIKFAGLEQERAELCRVIRETKQTLSAASGSAAPSMSEIAEDIYHTKVAGRTSEYVNTVLENTKPSSSTDSSDDD